MAGIIHNISNSYLMASKNLSPHYLVCIYIYIYVSLCGNLNYDALMKEPCNLEYGTWVLATITHHCSYSYY